MDSTLAGTDKHEELKALWRKRLQVLDLENARLKLYWILFIPLFLISQIIISQLGSGAEGGIVIMPLSVLAILCAFCGFVPGSWFVSGIIYSITTGIVFYNISNDPSVFLSIVLVVATALLWFFGLFTGLVTYWIYKLVWKPKYGDLIKFESFF